ncbi:tyrosine-type recombinase/integrase [Acidicapsa acidisoli]|uniref:tyrosine-type recombinase/integrase n=1 Tax=Acidicapsa acidisoli TaxID=1615681 RepID=UPI0021DFD93A|nr:site-specific integrase [Acidicapsa acidisoli]
MSIKKKADGLYLVRWREGGRYRSLQVNGGLELAKKIERKKLSARDENRHLDVKKEINYRMSYLIDRYWDIFGSKKASADREISIVEGIRAELGRLFVREADGAAMQRWYENLTGKRGLAANTAVRHFNVMHHMMEKAATIWSKDTGIEKNPADMVEVLRPDDTRERFLSKEELERLKVALDERMLQKGTKDLNRTNLRMRLIVLIALATGMRSTEIHRLCWSDVMFGEGLIAVRARLKKGKVRYVPMAPQLAEELRSYPVVENEDRLFPPTRGKSKSGRQRLEGSFEDLLLRVRIRHFRFHDLRHTFASWYMMIGGDLYELAKILGHANIKMTERYAKLGRAHIAKTGVTAKAILDLLGSSHLQTEEQQALTA